MSLAETLVTDRTQADVDRVGELKTKIAEGGFDALTAAEQAEYMAGMRGAYNYTDLNRVGSACAALHELFTMAGVALPGYTTPKTDWDVSDVPTAAQMGAYLANVAAFKSAAALVQTIPESMDRLDYEGANDIEKLLLDAEDAVKVLMRDWLYSGEFMSGEF